MITNRIFDKHGNIIQEVHNNDEKHEDSFVATAEQKQWLLDNRQRLDGIANLIAYITAALEGVPKQSETKRGTQ